LVYRATESTEARKAARRRAILFAARDVVSSSDFAGLRVASVARAAGVGTGTVYRYFPSKTELALEVFRHVSGHELAWLEDLAQGEGSVAELIESLVEAFVGRALEAPRLAHALLAEPLPPEVAAERLRFRRAFARVFQGLIERGIAAGDLPEQDPALSATWLIGGLSEALYGPLVDPAERDDLIQSLSALAFRSLGLRPGVTP
jgi:AcrR family transcriptional regulator